MKKRKALLDRNMAYRYMSRLNKAKDIVHPNQHVRAELDRLARQIRKMAMTEPCEFNLALSDVLDLIREAKK